MDLSLLRDRLSARLPDVIGTLRARATEHGATIAREGFTIQNAAGDEAVIRIYDEISWYGVNALDFANALDGVTAAAIRVDINSPGGDVFDGIAIYNALRNHPATVTTRVDGLAASIASIIAQAGDRRLIQASGQMMIHNAWGLTVGDNRDHADMAKLLQQQDAVLAGIYAARSGRDADEFRDLMNAETWFTADAAVAAGLADEVIEPPAKAALADQILAAVSAVAGAVTSAEQVSAVRAEVGKPLSNSHRESLSGLRADLDRLLGVLEPEESRPAVTHDDEWRALWALRLPAD